MAGYDDIYKKINFLVVGAQKCGTTSLYRYFNDHPQIYVPRRIKESNFFVEPKEILGSGPRYHGVDSYAKSISKYNDLFQDVAKHHVSVGEVCPSYLPFYSNSIPNILNYLKKDVRIVIVIRNPVDRAYSHYMHNVRDCDEKLSFEDALAAESERISKNYWNSFYYIRNGMYHDQIKAYLDHFSNVKVLLFEDLFNRDGLMEVFSFLGVENRSDMDPNKKYNVSGVPKNYVLQSILTSKSTLFKYPRVVASKLLSVSMKKRLLDVHEYLISLNIKKERMNPCTREDLVKEFEPNILQTSSLIGRDLSHWLK